MRPPRTWPAGRPRDRRELLADAQPREDAVDLVVEILALDRDVGRHLDHFQRAMKDMPQALVATPKIVSRQVEGEGWGEMGELTVE